jgi:nucleotide-binding universal stress UspA family protein
MLKKILVPIDFSPPCLQTLRYAMGLAERFGARVHMVHVLDFAPLGPQRILPPAFRTDMTRSATKRLRELAAQFSFPPEKDSLTVVIGRTGDEINKVARKSKADLIVIATRGYSGLKYAFFGSTA